MHKTILLTALILCAMRIEAIANEQTNVNNSQLSEEHPVVLDISFAAASSVPPASSVNAISSAADAAFVHKATNINPLVASANK